MKNSQKKLTVDQQIERMIDDITNDMDDHWLEQQLEDYSCCFENKDILEGFLENYRSKSIGIAQFDDLEASDIRKKVRDDQALIKLLKDSAEFITCDYHTQWNELAGIQIGEIEHTIDLEYYPELEKLIKKSSNPKYVNSYGQILAYGVPCDRLILKLDAEIFLEALAGLFSFEKNWTAPVIQLDLTKKKQKDARQRFVDMQLQRQGLFGKLIQLRGAK